MIKKFDPHAIPARNVAELLSQLGDVSPERVFVTPPVGTATPDDVVQVMRHPKRKVLAELVDGTLVEKPMGWLESILAIALGQRLRNFLEPLNLGVVSGESGAFKMHSGGVRMPDVAFVPWELIPEDLTDHKKIADLPPVLAVEILSESNTPKEIAMKLAEYFDRGCKLAWIIDPATETATVYTSAKRGKAIPADGELTGGKVLPGFALKLADLFAATKRPAKK